MSEEKDTARTGMDRAKMTWDPKTKKYRPTRYKKPPKQKPKTPKQIEENATPNGSPINLIKNIVTNKDSKKNSSKEKTKELQRTVALAGCFVGMKPRDIARMTGLSAVMVTRRLSEVLSLDPVVEARERMESYLPLAIQRAIERIEAGDNDLLRDLLKGAGVFQSYHQIRDRSQEATEEQLRASAKELLLKELRAGAVSVRYTKSPQPPGATNSTAGSIEHQAETSETSQPTALQTQAHSQPDDDDLSDVYASQPEADPPAPVAPLAGSTENRLSVPNFTGFLGEGVVEVESEESVGSEIDSGEVQGGYVESSGVGATSDTDSPRKLRYGAVIDSIVSEDEEGSDAAGE